MMRAFGLADTIHDRVRGRRFDGAIAEGESTGSSLAADVMGSWLAQRFPLAA